MQCRQSVVTADAGSDLGETSCNILLRLSHAIEPVPVRAAELQTMSAQIYSLAV